MAPSAPHTSNVKVNALLTALGMSAVPLRLADVVSAEGLAGVAAALMIVVGIVYGLRLVVHVYIGYWMYTPTRDWRWSRRDRRNLSMLMVGDAVLASMLVVAGSWFLLKDVSSGWQSGGSAAMAILVAVSSHATLKLARRGGLRRGSEAIVKCWLVEWLRDNVKLWQGFPGVAWLDRLCWEMRTPVGQVSGLVMVVVIMLTTTPLANGLAELRDVMRKVGDDKAGEATGSTTTATATTLQPTQTTATPSPSEPEATRRTSYEDHCGTAVLPGQPPGGYSRDPREGVKPDDPHKELERLWRSVGGIFAACGGPAQVVPNTHDVLYVTGTCAGEAFPSVAVTSPRHRAALLLEGWATFAKEMIAEGRLRGASSKQMIGTGDFQVVYTDAGGYVLIRREVSDGKGGFDEDPESCADLEPATQRPVRVPPGLADLWLRYAAEYEQRTWPVRDVASDRNGRRFFVFKTADGNDATVAVGSCAAPRDCELQVPAGTWKSTKRGSAPVTAGRVLKYGPR